MAHCANEVPEYPNDVFQVTTINVTDTSTCENYVILSASEHSAMNPFSFDIETFEMAFGYAFLLWVTGFTIGLIVAKIRQTRAPT